MSVGDRFRVSVGDRFRIRVSEGIDLGFGVSAGVYLWLG